MLNRFGVINAYRNLVTKPNALSLFASKHLYMQRLLYKTLKSAICSYLRRVLFLFFLASAHDSQNMIHMHMIHKTINYETFTVRKQYKS